MTEIEALIERLDGMRASVLDTLSGLTEEQARHSTVPSGTNLAGLLQHLTYVESKWFEHIVAGGKATRGKRSMIVDQAVTLRELRAEYREAWAASNAIVRAIGDADHPIHSHGKQRDLRWAMLAVINEVARHTGHADIIREQIDGRTGR